MRLPWSRVLVPLLPLISLAAVTVSPRARAQSDAPGSTLPTLPETERASPPPTSAPQPTAAPVPTLETAPTPTETTPVGSVDVAREMYGRPLGRYRHEGFYLAVDAGIGFFGAWGSGPRGSASMVGVGTVGDVAIGGTVATGLVLGGVARQWSTMATFHGGPTITATTTYFANGVPRTNQIGLGNAHATSAEIGAFLDWYPDPEKGWHVGASLGLGGMRVTDDAGTSSMSTAVAGSIFGGYQWWLGRAWSLGLAGVVSGATTGRFDDSNQNDTGYRLTPFGVGLASQLLYY